MRIGARKEVPFPGPHALAASQGAALEVWKEEQGVRGCARVTCDLYYCGRENALLGRPPVPS